MYPKIWVEMTAIAQAKTQVKRGTTRALNEVMDIIEGGHTNYYLRSIKLLKYFNYSTIINCPK